MSLLCVCVFLSLLGARQQIAGTVVGDRKAGREKRGRKTFCKLGKGHRQNALKLSCTIGSLALREQRGGEKFAFSCVRSVLYLIPPRVEPWERAFVLKSSCVYCTFCLPFLFCLGSTPSLSPTAATTSVFTKSDSLSSLCWFNSNLEVLQQPPPASEWMSNWRRFFFYYYYLALFYLFFLILSFRGAARVEELLTGRRGWL